jgi:hypothetical protein
MNVRGIVSPLLLYWTSSDGTQTHESGGSEARVAHVFSVTNFLLISGWCRWCRFDVIEK